MKFFKMPMTIYGFTFSFWDIALWGCVAYIAIRIIRGLLMDNELMNEETTEQTTEENTEAGGEEQGSETPAAPADGEQQEEQAMTEITGTVTVDNLYDRPIMSTPFPSTP